MGHLKGVTATIEVDGQPLIEYPDEEADDVSLSSTNHFIESRVGKEFAFSIAWDASIFNSCVGLGCRIFVDGVLIDRPVIFADARPPRICTGPTQCTNGIWTEKPFRFADVQLG